MVHSRDALIPVPDALTVAAELRTITIAIMLVGLDNLDKVIVRKPYEAEGVVSPNLNPKAQGGVG